MGERRLLGGRYELDGVIGRGGMAEVYRARDVRLDRIVAIKTLRDDLAGDQTFQARFRREAQSAASLNHPSIVAVYDTGEDMMGEVPVPYIVMQYADGRTLADLLGEGRRLLPGRALEITEGVLRALAYSHRNGIVHRDIKPSNVMVTRHGDVKVMDFGIARSLGRSQATLTQTAQVIGTAQYMSPEQARGERVDARSDLYSAGYLLYELLTSRPPFRGDSPVTIAYQHVREAPVPPSQLDPQIPRWADAIVLKAMAKASGWRLGPPVAGTPPATPIAGRSYGTGTPPPGHRRRRAVLWMLSAVLVLAAVIAAASIVPATGSGKWYAVPDVRGLIAQQAGQKIIANHLQPHFLSRSSPSVPKGQVIGTSPAAGAMAPAGSTVTVYVSAGQHQRAVPDVVGEDVPAARSKIVNAGLNPVVKTDTASTAPANTVVRQSPAAGTAVNPGRVVTIYVSRGGTAVPDATGDPAATAKSILRGQGFTVTEVKRPGPSPAAGTVYAQNPAGGTLLPPGSPVTIYVQPATALAIVAAPAALPVAQGSAGTFRVALPAAPTSTVTVTVTFTSGNTGLAVTSGGTLTFTASDWNTAQDVTITADSSSTGMATFTATAPGYARAAVNVTETSATSGNGQGADRRA